MKKLSYILLFVLILPVILFATDPQDNVLFTRDYMPWGYNPKAIQNYVKYSDITLYNKTLDTLLVSHSSDATSGTTRAGYISLTQTGAGAISEGLHSIVIANVHTGSWVNGIVGRVDYSTGSTGDASGGMAAAICAEMNLPARTPSGGTYTCLDLELEAPENYSSITSSTSFPVSFMRMGLWGNATATDNWQDYGYILHLADLDDASGNVFYDNTLRMLVNTTAWYLPLSDAEGEYSSAYQIDISNTTDASSTITGSIQTDGGLGVAKKAYVGTDLDVDGTSNLDNVDIDGTFDLTATLSGGANTTFMHRMNLAAGETFTGTTGFQVKVYDADNTVVHDGGEHCAIYANMKILSAMTSGGKSVLYSGHNYGSGGDYQIIDAGMWLYGNFVDAWKVSGGSIDTGVDLSETTVTNAQMHTSSGAKIFTGTAANGDAIYAEVGSYDAIGSIYLNATNGYLYIQVANTGAATDWFKVTATDAD